MVIIRMTGGLGNQMFQYALYMKLTAQGKEVKFDDINEYRHANARPIMLAVFGIEYPRATWDEIIAHIDGSTKISHRIRRKLRGRKSLEIHEKGNHHFDPEILEHDPAYLCGYFQSEKYWQDIAGEVRRAFTFPEIESLGLPPDLESKMAKYQEMIDNTEAVSVHIRRGDYLMVEEAYGGICTDAYYESAIAYLRTRHPGAVFFIFSNDTRWAGNWLEKRYVEPGGKKLGGQFCLIEDTTEHTGYLDMMLMSRCRHHIIANSSFSWWGSYLGSHPEKITIAPEKWLANSDGTDIFTEGMARISSEGLFV